MAIFGNNVLDTYDDNVNLLEGYDVESFGNFNAFVESFDDELSVIEAMHAHDMAEIEGLRKISALRENAEQEGVDPDDDPVIKQAEDELNKSMEASVKDIWEKLKAGIKKLFDKIMSFFASVGRFVAALFVSGKKFADMYGAKVKALKLGSGMPYDMYDWQEKALEGSFLLKNVRTVGLDMQNVESMINKINSVQASNPNAAEILSEIDNGLSEYSDTFSNTIRNKMVTDSSSGSLSSEDYSNALFELFRGNNAKKTEHKITDASKYIDFLASTKDLAKSVSDARESVNKEFKTVLDRINKASSTASKEKDRIADKKYSAFRKYASIFSVGQRVMTQYINAWSTAIKEYSGVSKSVCLKALAFKPEAAKK